MAHGVLLFNVKIWETAFKLQIGISVLKEHKSTAVTLVAIEKQFMACVSSEAFVEITTRLRKTGHSVRCMHAVV